MSTASWALQKALYLSLVADPAVLAALNGPHVYDHVPRGRPHPYVTFGPSIERDWSTGDSPGHEHEVALHVWTNGSGRREVEQIVSALREAVHDQELQLDGHRVINLRHASTEITREEDGESWRGLIRLRAVTEPGV